MADEPPLPGQEDTAAFSYWDGSRKRIIDPLEAGAILETECPDYLKCLEKLAEEVPAELAALMSPEVGGDLLAQKAAAKEKLLAIARKMFGLKALSDDGGMVSGLGRKGTMDILMAYFSHMGGMASAARPFVNSQQPDSPSILPDSTAEPSVASGGLGVS